MMTNVLKKNPNYKKIVKLWDFLRQYDDVGYVINVTEQNPQINERFQRDIYHNILFQYIILKGYLEDEKDRQVPAPLKKRKRKLKPKIIRQIIEELTEDYDLPDVEIRKVLIEELTKEDLMKEEAAERLRLVEELEERIRDEEERERLRKEAEELRRQQEQESEEARLQTEKEAEEQRIRVETMKREMEDQRRGLIFRTELDWFNQHKEARIELRTAEEDARAARERSKTVKENAALKRYQQELDYFAQMLSDNKEKRVAYEAAELAEQEALRQEKELKQQLKKSAGLLSRWRKG